MPQDQLFKELLQEFFREFLELFYPEVAARLDFEQVTFLDKETFTDLSAGRRREADLVARVRRRDSNTLELVLIHIEVQTQRRGVFPQRMFEYYALFRLRYRLGIFPIVLYLTPGAGGIVEETYVEQLFDEEQLRFRYKAVGLPDLQADDYIARPNPLGPALSALMHTRGGVGNARRKAEILRQRAIIDANEARRTLLLNVVEQNMALDAAQQSEFQRLVETPEFQEVKQMITPYEQRGIEIGLQQGMHRAVLQLLRTRFGVVAPDVQARLEAVNDPVELEELLARIVKADSVESIDFSPN